MNIDLMCSGSPSDDKVKTKFEDFYFILFKIRVKIALLDPKPAVP